ncbi:MAG: ribosomal-processing cysteine protease Prp [Faecalibacterium sp.]|jgi:uncharacterized protein YsxB (DUF464 family)|nr:ribosomal-processing cysteine protease Prp [Faecalibacterium sp.]
MTQIEILIEPVKLPDTAQDGGALVHELRMTVCGHAGYAPKGQDIVCAAVSILVQALACTLAKMSRETLYDFAVDGVAGSGCVGITAIPTAQGGERIRGAFESAMMGFCLLSEAYPAYVRVHLARSPRPKDRREEKADA